MARPALSLVDTETGELPDDAPSYAEALGIVAEQEDTIAGLESEIRSLAAKLTRARRNREMEAKGHDLWPVAERLFDIWKHATGNRNSRSKLTADRFEMVYPFLDGAETDVITFEPGPPRNALEDCAAAIIGRTTYPFTTTRENGTTKKFHEWNRIFKSADEKDDSAARRPKNWRELLRAYDGGPR